jgi:hypothetical protein
MDNLPRHRDAPATNQDALMQEYAELAATHLDDERMAELVKRLVSTMVHRADGAPTGQETARRHSRIQNLIKRL